MSAAQNRARREKRAHVIIHHRGQGMSPTTTCGIPTRDPAVERSGNMANVSCPDCARIVKQRRAEKRAAFAARFG